jgi:hypothetical protein
METSNAEGNRTDKDSQLRYPGSCGMLRKMKNGARYP